MATMMHDVDASGGYLSVPTLSKKLHKKVTPILRFGQFVKAEGAAGLNKGDEFKFDLVDSELSSTPSATSDLLAEDAPIGVDTFSIAQGTATILEYGKAVPFTGKLNSLGQIGITDTIEEILRRRLGKILDCVHAAAFKLGDVFYTPTGAAAGTWDLDGTVTTTATATMNAWHWREVVDYMSDTLMIPPFFEDSDEYVAICAGKSVRGLYDDPDFEKVQNYAEPGARLRGELGRYYRTRIVRTNHVGALSNSKGTGSVLGECVFFGADPVIHHVALAPEIRVKNPGDFGRDRGLAWYGMFTTDCVWKYVTHGESRIVYVTSA